MVVFLSASTRVLTEPSPLSPRQEAWIDTATHNDLAEEDLTLTAIRDALHIELSRGCIDVQGKSQTFLQYTERKFPVRTLPPRLLPPVGSPGDSPCGSPSAPRLTTA